MNTMILPPAPPPVSEIRYDLESDIGQLDLISCHRLILLTDKWRARNAAARIARLRAETDRYFGRGV